MKAARPPDKHIPDVRVEPGKTSQHVPQTRDPRRGEAREAHVGRHGAQQVLLDLAVTHERVAGGDLHDLRVAHVRLELLSQGSWRWPDDSRRSGDDVKGCTRKDCLRSF